MDVKLLRTALTQHARGPGFHTQHQWKRGNGKTYLVSAVRSPGTVQTLNVLTSPHAINVNLRRELLWGMKFRRWCAWEVWALGHVLEGRVDSAPLHASSLTTGPNHESQTTKSQTMSPNSSLLRLAISWVFHMTLCSVSQQCLWMECACLHSRAYWTRVNALHDTSTTW